VIAYFTPDSISAKKSALIEAKKIILEKHREEFAKNKRQFALMIYSIGILLCQDGQMKDGRDYLFTAYRLNKMCVKSLFAITLSYFGGNAFNRVRDLYLNLRQG
jgi:hypothetical protein